MRKRFVPILILIVTLLVVAFLIKGLSGKAGFTSADLGDGRYQLPNAKFNEDINREFKFPLKDDKGETVAEFKYTIEKAEIRSEIIVQGKKANSIRGRIYLIINLKLVNDFSQSVDINTRDFVRLVVNNDEPHALAADIHNDPVEVQAISTKYTRIGFAIDDNYQNLALKVGEIKEEKQTIELSLN